ncbi:hypothetical protein PGT21_011815 [Puccinia graminis f. sp. tritici]|uniref:CxC1-like cysteine cluster associated with KDZ transposases domain-containing protein n=1 Tax=Puccinia graminis f. sp. tritici TaxID=56615 RepID=A0A5B0NWE0_PUCGR|nr:hypothetical protein PGT21_011815 [Puccinia graminis f. sp. tritici]KAA1092128.1 hypothetical protein PGTUg99_002336 [Puccinia graminis f. sp. tritici]
MANTRFSIRGADRTQILRRQVHAARIAASVARMQQQRNLDRQRAQLAQPMEFQNIFDVPNQTNNDQPNEQGGPEDDEERDEDCVWVDLIEDQPDEIDLAIASARERHRQQARDFNWAVLIHQLHATYMKLKTITQNWAGANAYDSFASCSPTCTREYPRVVDLVDIRGQQRQTIRFCACTPDGVRLLQHGYLAGSPVKPQTAFSLPLLIFHNHLWNNCNIGTLPFTTALTSWLEPRSQRLCVRKGKHARQMRKPFTAAVDLFRQLEEKTTKVIFSSLQLTEQQTLACTSCPSCFGPPPANPLDYPEITRNRLIVCLDGNFQHRHQTNSSRNYERLRTPRVFLKQSTVDKVAQEIRAKEAEGMTPEQTDRCTESHKAADDKRNESTWKGCDDTGLMGCCCRHDAVVYLANIFKSGEKRHFPMAIIQALLSAVEPTRPIGILYDIGCSLDKYIDRRGLIPNDRSRVKFGTSVFHAYAHNWLCQLDYHPRFNQGWGLSDGEGLERMWSYLSSLVSPLRYATRNHRLGAIAHRLKHHNHRGIQQLPHWLRKKFSQAVGRRQENQTTLAQLLAKANPHNQGGGNFTISFFKSQWASQRSFQQDHTVEEETRRAQLISFYKREATVELLRERLRSPEIYLEDPEEVRQLMDSILEQSDLLQQEAEELAGSNAIETGDPEEQKLRLLLWDAKAALFVEAVHINAERQPLNNSHTMGSRLGTRGKEKIIKGLQARRAAGKKLIDAFNDQYQKFTTKYPDVQLSDASDHPLTYDEFSTWPMDHRFWNDGLYYHSTEPWSVDPDVRTGINCVLILRRTQEEFELIAQELARAVGWATSHYRVIEEKIRNIRSRINLIQANESIEPDYLDAIVLGDLGRVPKLKLINDELELQLKLHGQLLLDWSDNVTWLWNRCQPHNNRAAMSDWISLVTQITNNSQPHSNQPTPLATVDDDLEEAGLDDVEDGEDVEDQLISDAEADWQTRIPNDEGSTS